MNLFQSSAQTYLNKFSSPTKLIKEDVDNNCRNIIVIPSYNETDDARVLMSLLNCSQPDFGTEVIVVFNCGEHFLDAFWIAPEPAATPPEDSLDHNR